MRNGAVMSLGTAGCAAVLLHLGMAGPVALSDPLPERERTLWLVAVDPDATRPPGANPTSVGRRFVQAMTHPGRTVFGIVEVELLEGQAATRAAIVSALTRAAFGARREDLVVAYLAGSTLCGERTGRAVYLTSDARPDALAASALSIEELWGALSLWDHLGPPALVVADLIATVGGIPSTEGHMTPGGEGAFPCGLPPPTSHTPRRLSPWGQLSSVAPNARGPGEAGGSPAIVLAALEDLPSIADVDVNGLVDLAEWHGRTRALASENGILDLPQWVGDAERLPLLRSAPQPERCDGMDNNHNLRVDEGFPDRDGDGAPDCAVLAEECNRLDDDGDSLIDEDFDRDRDGYLAGCPGTLLSDCDDHDPKVRPGVADPCDGLDNDCDGRREEDGPDLDHNARPDCVDAELAHLKRRAVPLSGTAGALAIGSALAVVQSQRLRHVDQMDGVVDPLAEEAIRDAWTRSACLAVPAALLFGVGFSLSSRGLELRRMYSDAPAATGEGGLDELTR